MTRKFNGSVPEFILFEDSKTMAFLDSNPKVMGHTLIIPKIHVDHWMDVPEDYYAQVHKTAKLIGRVLLMTFESHRINQVVSGYHVPHFHLHLYPSFSEVCFRPKWMDENIDNLQMAFEVIIKNLS
ncbi:MAG: HIT family protein [Patescibacteria group bacterium]